MISNEIKIKEKDLEITFYAVQLLRKNHEKL